MGRGSAGGAGFRGFVQFVALPLLLANLYALWRIAQTREAWHVRLLPGGVGGSLEALVMLLAANTAVVVILLIVAGRRG